MNETETQRHMAKMVEALRPFAAAADAFGTSDDDFIVHIIQTPGDHAIRVGHLRAARAALEASYYEAHPLPWQIEAEPDDPDRPYRIKDANGDTVIDTRWGACTKSGRDLYAAIVRAANAKQL